MSEFELVQVGVVPAGEGIIDGSGQLGKGVAAGGCENPAGAWPQILAASTDEVNADRQPGTTHGRMLSDSDGRTRRQCHVTSSSRLGSGTSATGMPVRSATFLVRPQETISNL
jgi:hypothetical protein